MDIIVFSKDRACQLDLCIRSIKEHAEANITVLLDWSNQEYLDGYSKLLSLHKGVSYIHQGDFMTTLRKTVRQSSEYIVMMVDDSIFINKFYFTDELELGSTIKRLPRVKCASLMLTAGVNYCYAHDKCYVPFTLERMSRKVYSFNWTYEEEWSDWGYPHQVGGNFWTRQYLTKILRSVRANNPTELEGKLNFPLRKRRHSTPKMVCLDQQKILTVPINYIPKKEKENRSSHLYSLEELNDKFLDGYRLQLPKGIQSNAINKEIELEFERI